MQDFDKIYTQYFNYVYKFVLALCHDSDIAEEITQETFFKALKNKDSFSSSCTQINGRKLQHQKVKYPISHFIFYRM